MTSGSDRRGTPPADGDDGRASGDGKDDHPAGQATPPAGAPTGPPLDPPDRVVAGTGAQPEPPSDPPPGEESPASDRSRRLRFWESPAPAPTPTSARTPDTVLPADAAAPDPGAQHGTGSSPDDVGDGPAGEPSLPRGVEGGMPGFERMDTASMAELGPPARLPPFTDPPGLRLPDLRRHLRFWEVAPESVADRAGEGDRPAADQRPIWEWADSMGDEAGPLPLRPVDAGSDPAPPVLPSSPRFGTLAELRIESRDLRRRIQVMQSDLGGLHVEMARAASVDHALLEARALDLVAVGDRLVAVERAIEARRRGEDPSWTTLLPCSACGAPRPHDASFCPYCGSSVTPSRTWRAG